MSETCSQKNIVVLNQDLMNELQVIFMEYSERKGFPDAYCTKISKDLAENLGLHYQEGFFKLDFPNSKGASLIEHAWCTDAKGIIVDLTAHQFNANLIKPLSDSVQIINPKDLLYKRYSSINPLVK